MIIGIDIHGVIDTDPKFFSKLTESLRLHNHEVHIITGVEDNRDLRKFLSSMYIQYDTLFSITSYHKELGTPIVYKKGDLTQPLIDEDLWDASKAKYCGVWGIDIHIDDSIEYSKYFYEIDTKYIQYNAPVKEFLNFLITGVR